MKCLATTEKEENQISECGYVVCRRRRRLLLHCIFYIDEDKKKMSFTFNIYLNALVGRSTTLVVHLNYS